MVNGGEWPEAIGSTSLSEHMCTLILLRHSEFLPETLVTVLEVNIDQ